MESSWPIISGKHGRKRASCSRQATRPKSWPSMVWSSSRRPSWRNRIPAMRRWRRSRRRWGEDNLRRGEWPHIGEGNRPGQASETRLTLTPGPYLRELIRLTEPTPSSHTPIDRTRTPDFHGFSSVYRRDCVGDPCRVCGVDLRGFPQAASEPVAGCIDGNLSATLIESPVADQSRLTPQKSLGKRAGNL